VTIDWFVVLAPIVLLIVALPFVFVGCTRFTSAPDETTTPAPPGPGSPAPPPPPRATTFRFEMDPNLEDGLGAQQKVVRIEVFFRIQDSLGTLPAIDRPQPHLLIVNTQVPPPSPPAIDPLKEHVAPVAVPITDIGNRNQAVCNCVVTMANGNTPNVQPEKAIPIEPGLTYEFRVKSRRPQQNGFRVYYNGTGM
jgi:hypothetical protein